jgi:putative ABC transport system permease protein
MHSFWQQYFGSDPHALGQTVTLDGAPYAVVGVMPASFRFPGDSEAQILAPAGLAGLDQGGGLLNPAQKMLGIIGRLKPGVTAALAYKELDAIRKHAERC